MAYLLKSLHSINKEYQIMKTIWRILFSLSEEGNNDLKYNEDKFQMTSCPINGNNCKNHLPEINSDFRISNRAKENKNFQRSIKALRHGFYKSCELKDPICLKCSQLFCSSYIQSLEQIHNELEYMSSGLLGNKRYQNSCFQANDILNEFKKDG